MICWKHPVFLVALLSLGSAAGIEGVAQSDSLLHPFSSRAEIEEYLRTAEIVHEQGTPEGITLPRRLTLDNGTIRREAIFKFVDERKPGLTRLKRSTEVDFKDSWKFEVAAYELDKLLSLNMVPVTVERRYKNRTGSLQYWIEDCQLERVRMEKKQKPPNPLRWNWQVYKIAIFDKLIYNIDRNPGNILVTQDWRAIMIDHSRSFKSVDQVEDLKNLKFFSRSMMRALAALDEAAVREKCGDWITTAEIVTLMKRRDEIVKYYQSQVAKEGNSITYP
jgi:hypothetical protein